MESRQTGLRWRRVAAAAARLGALYAIGVAALVLPFLIFIEGAPQAARDLLPIAGVLAALFLIAFGLLAVTRRAGFAALWLLLLGIWARAVAEVWSWPSMLLIDFVMWSLLALPLYALGALGVPASHRLRLGRWRPPLVPLVLAAWVILAAVGLYVAELDTYGYYPSPSRRALTDLVAVAVPVLWAPAPFLIAAVAIAHVWAGTRRPSDAGARRAA